jgi:D-glycero-alpha-D-manno-heptose-7-phosphate kinase
VIQIISEAPTRLDLAGGTIDIWPLSQLIDHPFCINISVSLPAKTTLNFQGPDEKPKFILESTDQKLVEEHTWQSLDKSKSLRLVALLLKKFWTPERGGLHLVTHATAPAGSGLGGSSCLATTILYSIFTLIRTLDGEKTSKKPSAKDRQLLVESCRDIEARVIHAPTGVQDYWGAIQGGVNYYHFDTGRTHIREIDKKCVKGLDDHLLLFYSGQSRASALNNWKVFESVFNGNEKLLSDLEKIGRLAFEVGTALENGDVEKALQLSEQEWILRKSMWPDIETVATKEVDRVARRHGAIFSRVGGAGGGGVVGVFAPPEKHSAIIDACTKNERIRFLDAKISADGLQTTTSKA